MSARSSSSKTLDIIERLAEAPGGLSLADVADEFGLPKSVAHRLLAELGSRGYVVQESDTRRYRLTLWLPMLGFKYLASRGVVEIWQPILDKVAAESGEYVALGVAENDNLIWVASSRGQRTALQYEPVHGPVIRLHVTASGLAWLCTLPENRAVDIVMKRGFDLPSVPENYGRNAVRSVSELLERMQQTRERGYGISLESGEPGINAIGVAIESQVKGEAGYGTISIAGPAFRLQPDRLREFHPLLMDAAEQLSAIWPLRPTSRIKAALLASQNSSKIGVS